MTLRLYDMLYMGLTDTFYFVLFAMMDFSGFISKTGEFLSFVEATMDKELPIGRATRTWKFRVAAILAYVFKSPC